MSASRIFHKSWRRVRHFFADDPLSLTIGVTALTKYDKADLPADARAAANVTMLALPQALAYAAIAGVPIVYGLLSAAVAAIVAPWVAGSRSTVLGPTNATAFMLFSFFAANPLLAGRYDELVPLLVMMVGFVSVAAALLRMADLLQYISRSVLVGYVSGAAVLIIVNQLKHVLALAPFIDPANAGNFFGLVQEIIRALGKTNLQNSGIPLGIGTATAGFYFFLRWWRPAWPVFAIALVLSATCFGTLIHRGIGPFAGVAVFESFTFDDLTPSLPHLFRSTIFADISSLLAVALAIAFLASLENTMMAKTIASRTGDRADPNQDMFSVGVANLAVSVAGGMPASGSLNRSLLNYESGARSRFASLIGGVYLLLAALLIAWLARWNLPVIELIPQSALAAMVIAISFSLFNLRHITICLHSTTDDAIVLIFTFLATLLAPLHIAIFIGVAISITLFLRRASRPHLVEYEFTDDGELRERSGKSKRPIPSISIVHVEGDLFFGAAELFRTQIQRAALDPALRVIILRLKNARHLDATSVMALEDLIGYTRGRGIHIIVSGANREVYKVLKRSGVLETLQEGCNRKEGESNLFLSYPSNPNLSTRDALRRAQQLLGTDKADVRIFYDASKPT